ncbi:MAG TPA: non-ribosomal peptide synthetase, partial [Terriglobales bacterium]|nr:non-ribosomal peptide synthetase [Terriglobales bacterium]
IGPPIANTQFYILDAQNQPTPIGVPGELCIAGDGVARGYFNRPELTQDRFVPDPFRPGSRMYKTGDLARYLKDGTIDFLGRLDHQVKLRGYRIELGEIESVLVKHPNIAQAVVTVREDEPGDQRLVAYLVTKSGDTPQRAQLRAFAADKLPDYMIPSRFVELASLPLTANGKIDRKALPQPEAESAAVRTKSEPVPTASSAENVLLKIFSDVLKIESVTPTDSLLDLGADSIQIFQIATRANRAGFNFTPREILQQRTVEKLCQTTTLAANEMTASRKPLQRVDRERYRVNTKH